MLIRRTRAGAARFTGPCRGLRRSPRLALHENFTNHKSRALSQKPAGERAVIWFLMFGVASLWRSGSFRVGSAAEGWEEAIRDRSRRSRLAGLRLAVAHRFA
jgi:hypothetical protein